MGPSTSYSEVGGAIGDDSSLGLALSREPTEYVPSKGPGSSSEEICGGPVCVLPLALENG
jgi:hypothetical protein